MLGALYALLAVVLLLVFRALVRILFRPVTVYEYYFGLKYCKGKYIGILPAGKYWIYYPTTHVTMVDSRAMFATVNGQEVLSSDGITLKVSLAVQYKITDPHKAINTVESYTEALHLTLQMKLREIVGTTAIDDLLEKRSELGSKLFELTTPAIEQIGITLIEVEIKDIMLPGEVKKLFNQIVKARKEGQAILEKARSETAALRNLANAAKMMEENPSLLQLRALQQLGESTGNTLVLGMPSTGIQLKKAAGNVTDSEK